jgi:hypothetical protein
MAVMGLPWDLVTVKQRLGVSIRHAILVVNRQFSFVQGFSIMVDQGEVQRTLGSAAYPVGVKEVFDAANFGWSVCTGWSGRVRWCGGVGADDSAVGAFATCSV